LPVRPKPAVPGGAPRNIIEPVKGREEIPAAPGDDVRLRLRERFSALRAELERLRFETDQRWEELLSRLSENPEEILPEELLRAPAEALSSRRGAISLHAMRRLDGANDQVEVLLRFLEECLNYASRAALLVERDGGLHVWKRAGFAGPSGPGSTLPEDAALHRVREGFPQALPEGNAISRAIGAEDAVEAVIFPFAVRESVSGAVYADALAEGRSTFDPDSIALLAWLAGLAVDRLAGRKLVPAPALRPIEGSAPAAAASSPAAGNGSVGGPLAPPQTDDRRDEARRFARLLASEIKLYNEGVVREGREHGNLYFRLREDIERGRRLYEERVPADVRGDGDYYYEELVDVLAGGRPEALGSRG
jgi:hypothetical protein